MTTGMTRLLFSFWSSDLGMIGMVRLGPHIGGPMKEKVVLGFLRSPPEADRPGRPHGDAGDDPLLEELLNLATQADHGETGPDLGPMAREDRHKLLFGS